ncbi:hypothetical protein ACIQU5_05680 [Streptomyces sp. NPDC090306]|uniref:effector-associated constant component EACC1 n=1 Tax=unclassified Streptomyces TaxID=2593676 RepID=UPI0036EE6FB0
MLVRVSMVRDDESEEIKSLYRWLSNDPDVHRAGEVSLGSDESRPGSMGWDADSVNILVSNTIAGVNTVIAAVALWRANRTSGSRDVRVDTDDTSVVLTDESPTGATPPPAPRSGPADPSGTGGASGER